MEAFCFSHRRFLTDGASPRVQPRQASAPLWCTDVDLGNAQRYAKFANGRPGNPKVARLWRWQWPKSLIFLLPSKRKRIEPTQCHLNSRNLPSPHRPFGEGDQVLFEKTTSWGAASSRETLQLSLWSAGRHTLHSRISWDILIYNSGSNKILSTTTGICPTTSQGFTHCWTDEVTKKLDKLRFYATRLVM